MLFLIQKNAQLDIFSFLSLTFYTILFLVIIIYFFQNYIVPKIAESLKSRRITFNIDEKIEMEKIEFEDIYTPLVKIVKNQEHVIKNKIND